MSRDIIGQFGRRVREARERLGFSRFVLARRAGLPAAYLARVEEGSCDPTLSGCQQIAAGLDLTLHDLLRPEEEPITVRKSLPPPLQPIAQARQYLLSQHPRPDKIRHITP